MAQNDYIAPVHHSALSATGTVAANAGGQALKSGGKAAMWWALGITALGFAIGMGWAGMAIEAAASAIAAIGTGTGVTGGTVLAWTVGAGIVGALTSPFMGVIGGVFGLGKGTADGLEKVHRENGAAREMDGQLAAMQYQAQAEQAQAFAVAQQAQIAAQIEHERMATERAAAHRASHTPHHSAAVAINLGDRGEQAANAPTFNPKEASPMIAANDAQYDGKMQAQQQLARA